MRSDNVEDMHFFYIYKQTDKHSTSSSLNRTSFFKYHEFILCLLICQFQWQMEHIYLDTCLNLCSNSSIEEGPRICVMERKQCILGRARNLNLDFGFQKLLVLFSSYCAYLFIIILFFFKGYDRTDLM